MLKKKYNVIFDDDFEKELQKLSRQHQKLALKKLYLLGKNPYHPSLRTKKLRGCVNDYFESSVNMDIRLIWRFDCNTIIIMVDVGHHDILKKY